MSGTLVLRNVSVRYRDGAPEAVCGVSLSIAQGEHVALLGLNGSGKTTLLSTAVGLLPFTGEIEVCGLRLSRATERVIRDQTGFLFGVPDDQLLFPNVLDDVAFSLERRGVARQEARCRALAVMSRLGIGDLGACSPHTLSQGQRQRVALAGVLAAEPSLLLLDEPTASLDPVGKEELAELIVAQCVTVLLATHDLDFARRTCRRFIVFTAGSVLEDTVDADAVPRVFRQPFSVQPARYSRLSSASASAQLVTRPALPS